jgi:hypothetical protein
LRRGEHAVRLRKRAMQAYTKFWLKSLEERDKLGNSEDNIKNMMPS